MIGNVASRRYASALFDLGRESGQAEMDKLGAILADLTSTVEASPELASLFSNPLFSAEEKKSVLSALLDRLEADPVSKHFCELLADKGRLPLLGAISSDYTAMLDDAKGVSRGVLTTAVALNKSRQKSITAQLAAQTGRELELSFTVDKSLLGGLTLRLGDFLLDASLRAQIDKLRESIKRGE